MGKTLEFALTLFVVNLITSIFACLMATEIGYYVTELFSTILDVLPK